MKKVVFAGMAIATGMLITGCTSVNTSDGGGIRKHPVMFQEAYKTVYAPKSVQVEAKAEVLTLFGHTIGNVTGYADKVNGARGNIEKAAYYNACKEHKADAILAARYEKEVTSFGTLYRKESCTIKGFPASITGIEKIPVNEFKEYQCLTDAAAVAADNSGGDSLFSSLMSIFDMFK